MAAVRVYITWGTTEATITASSLVRSSPNRWKYWHTSRPISSEVALLLVIIRKEPSRFSPSKTPNSVFVLPTSIANNMFHSSLISTDNRPSSTCTTA